MLGMAVVRVPMVPVPMVSVPLIMPVAMRIAVFLALAIVIAIVMAIFAPLVVAVEVALPATMPIPVRAFSAPRERAMIAEPRIVMAVNVAIEAHRSAEPRSRANEDSIRKPCRSVIAERRAPVGRIVKVAVRAHRLWPDVDVDAQLGVGSRSGNRQAERGNCCYCKNLESLHSSSLHSGINCPVAPSGTVHRRGRRELPVPQTEGISRAFDCAGSCPLPSAGPLRMGCATLVKGWHILHRIPSLILLNASSLVTWRTQDSSSVAPQNPPRMRIGLIYC